MCTWSGAGPSDLPNFRVKRFGARTFLCLSPLPLSVKRGLVGETSPSLFKGCTFGEGWVLGGVLLVFSCLWLCPFGVWPPTGFPVDIGPGFGSNPF